MEEKMRLVIVAPEPCTIQVGRQSDGRYIFNFEAAYYVVVPEGVDCILLLPKPVRRAEGDGE